MYYSSGTYEAFAHPEKPEGVEKKSAYIIGTGLAGLTAAFYLVRDGQMPGNHIHLLEKLELAGGSCDGYKDVHKGFYMRGGREMDNHFEIMWDVFRDVPSIETPNVSVLDEYYWLNKHDPNYSLCRATVNKGEDAHTDKLFKLHIDGLPDFSALRFTKYNQYESMILPLIEYLKKHDVDVQFGMDVKNVIIEDVDGKKTAKELIYVKDNKEQSIPLTADDLVFITNGCCTDTSCYGDQTHAPDLSHIVNGQGESWDLWKNIAKQAKHDEYGHPDVFCSDTEATNWMSATVETSNEDIIQHIMNICKRDPRAGKVTTGGIVTVKDSVNNWFLSWTINRQPQFRSQNKDTVLVWLYALHTDTEGNYIKKTMRDCTGEEICQEWLYHIGMDESKIKDYSENACNTTTCFMPYINAFFQPRKNVDRPKVVPEGAVNFAFIGQFAETPRDTIFTTEYSMRTGMESVYTLLNVDRGVPEVWGSQYDIRELLRAAYYAVDKKKINELPLNFKEKMLLKTVLKNVKGTDLELLLRDTGLIE